MFIRNTMISRISKVDLELILEFPEAHLLTFDHIDELEDYVRQRVQNFNTAHPNWKSSYTVERTVTKAGVPKVLVYKNSKTIRRILIEFHEDLVVNKFEE